MRYLLTLCLAAAFAAPVRAQQEPFTGKIFAVNGFVEYQKPGTSEWVFVDGPRNIEEGGKVLTGPNSSADLYIKYGAKIRLGPATTFVLTQAAKEGSAMQLLEGRMQAWIRKAAGRRLSVRTPSAVCAIRGTEFEADVNAAGTTVWSLFEGSVQVSDNNNNVMELSPGQRVTVTTDAGLGKPESMPFELTMPPEPGKTKEEIEEILAEQTGVTTEQRTEKIQENMMEELTALPVPASAVLPTQEVQESYPVSGSTP